MACVVMGTWESKPLGKDGGDGCTKRNLLDKRIRVEGREHREVDGESRSAGTERNRRFGQGVATMAGENSITVSEECGVTSEIEMGAGTLHNRLMTLVSVLPDLESVFLLLLQMNCHPCIGTKQEQNIFFLCT